MAEWNLRPLVECSLRGSPFPCATSRVGSEAPEFGAFAPDSTECPQGTTTPFGVSAGSQEYWGLQLHHLQELRDGELRDRGEWGYDCRRHDDYRTNSTVLTVQTLGETVLTGGISDEDDKSLARVKTKLRANTIAPPAIIGAGGFLVIISVVRG